MQLGDDIIAFPAGHFLGLLRRWRQRSHVTRGDGLLSLRPNQRKGDLVRDPPDLGGVHPGRVQTEYQAEEVNRAAEKGREPTPAERTSEKVNEEELA